MEDPTASRMPRILSLDGGGVRGLSSLLILREVMEDIERRTGAHETPKPSGYFDVIGGTSTGGLIAIMLGLLGMVSPNIGLLMHRLLTNASRHIWPCRKRFSRLTMCSLGRSQLEMTDVDLILIRWRQK